MKELTSCALCGSKKIQLNLIGQTFSKWTVLSGAEVKGKRGSYFNCQCECGTKAIVNGNSLSRGASKQCGVCRKDNFVSKKKGIYSQEYIGSKIPGWDIMRRDMNALQSKTGSSMIRWILRHTCGSERGIWADALKKYKSVRCWSCNPPARILKKG